MATWLVGQGSDTVFKVTLRDPDGAIITTYVGTETLTAKVWPGRDLATTFEPAVAWVSAAGGTIAVTIAATDTVPGGADPEVTPGLYYVLVWLDDDSGHHEVYQGQLEIWDDGGAGTAPAVYTSMADLQDYADWVETLQKSDPSGTTGFLRQRARARQWLDNVILSRYDTGGQSLQLGDPGYGAGSWSNQDLGPSQWLRGQLAADALIVTDTVKEIVAKRALYLICSPKLGKQGGTPYQDLARLFAQQSENLVKCLRAELDTNQDGTADFWVNCGATALR